MVIEGYNIISEIYRGPVTTVFKAQHIALDRIVILKVLNVQWKNEQDLIKRFRREAKICARLDHPHIVNIFDFNTENELVYISMEFIEGKTLEDYWHANNPLSFNEIIHITKQIASGLRYAHQMGAVHRDIKPANIMISKDGQVKITDFGMATISDLPQITEQDIATGSPAFMSPEQVLGQKITPQSDLFNLGVTLYTICSDKSPFEEENIGATIQNILNKNPEKMDKLRPDFPDWFSNLLHSLLAKKSEDRPETAQVILDVLDANFINTTTFDNITPFHRTMDRGIILWQRISPRSKVLLKKPNIYFWIFPLVLAVIIISFFPSKEQTSSNKVTQKQKLNAIDSLTRKTQKNISAYSPASTMEHDTNAGEESELKHEEAGSALKIPVLHKNVDQSFRSKLFIIAKPWAKIFVDSTYIETTPLEKPIILELGRHVIELKNPNYQTFKASYNFTNAETETLIADLTLNIGYLNIRVLPWAKIYIDDEYRETTPIRNPLALAAGKHILKLVNPNFDTISDTIFIAPGNIMEKGFNLTN